MKTFKILSVLFLALAISACQKEENEPIVILEQEVVFGIDELGAAGLKSGLSEYDCPVDLLGNPLVPTVAEIEIEDNLGSKTTYTPQVFFLDGKLYTQSIKLSPGTYTITLFVLRTAIDGDIIMAIPQAGSPFAPYVTKSVNFDFEVKAFEKTEINIEVLCFIPRVYQDFGFFWFEITEIVIREFCFFGDICANGAPWIPSDFDKEGSAYLNVPGGIQVDMPAIFKIYAYKDDEALPNSPFSNLGFEDEPLCVQYPDKIRTTGEVFTFELEILVPDGLGGFVYVHYHTFTSTDGGPLDVTDVHGDGVIDFVLGTCNYSATDLQLSWGN
jgi:hypothetical protein